MWRIALAASSLVTVSLSAQWLDWRTPGIPRTADGRPDLAASAPRTHDGTPDLSGVWAPAPNPYRFDLIQDLKDEAIFRPAAEAVFQRRVVDFRRDDRLQRSDVARPRGSSSFREVARDRTIPAR